MNKEHYGELLAHRHALEIAIDHYEKEISACKNVLEMMYAERDMVEEKVRNYQRRELVRQGFKISAVL